MDDKSFMDLLSELPEEVISRLSFTMPWQDGIVIQGRDPDKGDAYYDPEDKEDPPAYRERLRSECWKKFNKNPQVNTAVGRIVGRIVGRGFETTSEIFEIQEVIDEIYFDWRNRLYDNWRQYVGRGHVEGELHLVLTLHATGFVEVDFLDPSLIGPEGDDDTGIIFHPKKRMMPLFYNIQDADSNYIAEQIPSVFVARSPELIQSVMEHKDYNPSLQRSSKTSNSKFKNIGGFKRFVLSWNRGYVTRRVVSYLRTIIEWLNHYETLKKYEIDHKKSSGAYLWTFSFDDQKAFIRWLALSDDDRKKTAITAPVQPGGRIFLPPGMKVEAKNPNLPKISGSDTDILEMITSGLDEPNDITTGTTGGTFASVKATRGPMSDKQSDETEYFRRFYVYDFWGSVFFLRSAVTNFPEEFKVWEAKKFDHKKKEPVFGYVKRRPEFLVDVSFPISESIDLEGRARAVLGVKHGPITDSLGIPRADAAAKLGIGGFGRGMLKKATEDEKYPSPIYSVDAESIQEKNEGEPKKDKNKKVEKNDTGKPGGSSNKEK